LFILELLKLNGLKVDELELIGEYVKSKMNYFITAIDIHHVRHLKNIHIPLSTVERKHLIITGKNGSGKTSVLEEFVNYLQSINTGEILEVPQWNKSVEVFINSISVSEKQLLVTDEPSRKIEIQTQIEKEKQHLNHFQSLLNRFSKVSIHFSTFENITTETRDGQFIITFFKAGRSASMTKPSAISKVDFKQSYGIEERLGYTFIQYLVYLKTQKAFADNEQDTKTAEEIDHWFDIFENCLKEIFEEPSLVLQFDYKNLNFNIIIEGKREPFDFTTMSAGHSSYLEIVAELIMRMEKNNVKSYELQGIVLIDEIETHLHVSLQKKILPFLTSFFPNIQFIVTTHSPFVMTSIDNTVIYDLENKILVGDLSAYSYESIIEKYFKIDQYSQEIKEKMDKYLQLMEKVDLTEHEVYTLSEIRRYLDDVPNQFAPGLKMKFNEMELIRGSEKL
jgi:predicted ATP-binding protein involved in virulence